MLVALIALVAVGAFVAAPGVKPAETPVSFSSGWCQDEGVSVITEFKGKSTIRCATDFAGTSWNALVAAGFEPRGTSAYPLGFVCQLSGLPKEQDCKDTPRYDEGSWAFFVARPGKPGWQYALTGAATHFTECGSAEAWVFVPAGDSPQTAKPATSPKTRVCK